jgi:hypothetical protein
MLRRRSVTSRARQSVQTIVISRRPVTQRCADVDRDDFVEVQRQ